MLDAGRPPYFFTAAYSNFDPKKERWDLSSFPALEQIVQANYDLVSGGGRCASLYLRKDKAEGLKAVEVPLKSDVSALVDGPTTERCDDWWAPDTPGATAEFSVASPTPVKEIWILSSRGGQNRDRGATKARITVVGEAGQRAERIVSLHGYPYWTVVAPSDVGPVTRIEIEPLDFVGEGPALAGVKAFSRAW